MVLHSQEYFRTNQWDSVTSRDEIHFWSDQYIAIEWKCVELPPWTDQRIYSCQRNGSSKVRTYIESFSYNSAIIIGIRLQEWVEGVDSENPLAVSLLADMWWVDLSGLINLWQYFLFFSVMECTVASSEAAEILFNRLCDIDKVRKKCWIRRIVEIRLKRGLL